MYFLAYTLSCLLFLLGLVGALNYLHSRSQFFSKRISLQEPPTFRSRAVVTFSLILPFAALSFVILTFNPMKIAQSLHAEGHYKYVVGSLFIPTICFLLGYYYFRKMVRT